MQKIKIITDSACDISKEDEKRLGIKIMSFPVIVDGTAYKERIDFTNEEFYNMMDNAKEMPTTSQLTPMKYLRFTRNFIRRAGRMLFMLPFHLRAQPLIKTRFPQPMSLKRR